MIVYEGTKTQFMDNVIDDTIDLKISSAFKNKIGGTTINEKRAWNNSMRFMYMVLDSEEIPYDSGIAIEYSIPATSKRIDFIITGKADNSKESAVIIELKQWEYMEKVEGKDGIVKTIFNSGLHETTHPSYQAWSYASMIEDYNETVQNDSIGLYPCAYLHNYNLGNSDPLTADIYKHHIEKAPIYTKGDFLKLRNFISKFIKYGDRKEILYKIENGKLRPSKSLQDSLLKMLKGNREFVMIDEQKQVYEQAILWARKSHKDGIKRVLIIKGGPGTGKSVVAVNLLVSLTADNIVCQYVSKNSAPRNIYAAKLKGGFKKTHIDNLFKGSGIYYDMESNSLDALIVDEAHRLNDKSGIFRNKGDNQIKEIIDASKFSIFFIDENQRIHIHDIGKADEIIQYAEYYNAEYDIMELTSQFRCNGSDSYLAWIDDVIQIRDTADFTGFNHDYEFRIFDDPNDLSQAIYEKNVINNKARLIAGYCWDWLPGSRNKTEHKDINIDEYDFHMSWNLDSTNTWAIDEKSVNEVGCIHTSQGLEFDYAGVIIGPDMIFRGGKIITDFNARAKTDNSLKGIKKMHRNNPQKAIKTAEEIIKNTYRTLLTRGQKGCYVFCTDKDLSEYLKFRLHMKPRKRQVQANIKEEYLHEEKNF